MPDQNIEMIMRECLRRLEAGETVDTILRDFPQQAAEIGPLLAAAAGLRRWQAPSLGETAREAALSRALAALPVAVPTNPSTGRGLLRRMRLQPVLLLALLLMLLLGSFGGSVAVAQASLPGDVLYGLKRTSEQARLKIATSHERRAVLYLTFASRRVGELVQLEAAQRVPPPNIVDDLQQDYDQCRAEIGQAGSSVQQPLIVQYQAAVQTQSQALTVALPVASSAARAIMMQAQTVNNGAATRLQLTPSPSLPPTATSTAATPTDLPGTSSPAETTSPLATTGGNTPSIPTLTPTVRPIITPTPTGPPAITRTKTTSTPTLTPTVQSTITPTLTGPSATTGGDSTPTPTGTPTVWPTITPTPTGPPVRRSTPTPSIPTLTPTVRPTITPTPTRRAARHPTPTPTSVRRATATPASTTPSPATPTSARRSTATPTSTAPSPARSKLPTTGTTVTPQKLLPISEPNRVIVSRASCTQIRSRNASPATPDEACSTALICLYCQLPSIRHVDNVQSFKGKK